MKSNETAQSVISYSVGGGGALVASLVELAQTAQALTIIGAFLVVVIRLAHDSVRFYRYLRHK